jgi:hypothetical protein
VACGLAGQAGVEFSSSSFKAQISGEHNQDHSATFTTTITLQTS